jgi:hypothetical protein
MLHAPYRACFVDNACGYMSEKLRRFTSTAHKFVGFHPQLGGKFTFISPIIKVDVELSPVV